ncbi:hypothetical protein [Roseovarius sp. MBR-6]|uniref:hypothetical protein n=1 Tax=Roseovarius sp. MBR-6 TaxID=3156459 RepID=UPI00339A49C0
MTFAVSTAPIVAHAQDDESPDSGTQAQTRIEADPETHEIRFYVEGNLAAVLKGDGLHVRNNVQFGGTVFDSGENFHFQKGRSKNDRKNIH